MTLSVLEAHFPTASLFRCDFSYQWHILWFFASAKYLVLINQTSWLLWRVQM